MKAVILAGGLGTRLQPFTNIIPKPLIPINGEESILEIQIKSLAHYGFDEIFIATNYKSEMIESHLGNGEKFGIKLSFSREEIRLGTCGPLSLIRDSLNEPFLVMNGDILTELNFKNFYEAAVAKDSLITVGVKELVTPFDFGNVILEGDEIISIEEKPKLRFKILSGIYMMKPEILDFVPNNEYFGIDDLLQIFLTKKEKIASYLIDEYWLDIGRVESLDEARERFATNS